MWDQFSIFPRPRGMETAGGISLPEWAGETVCGFCDAGKAWILPLYTYTRQNPQRCRRAKDACRLIREMPPASSSTHKYDLLPLSKAPP